MYTFDKYQLWEYSFYELVKKLRFYVTLTDKINLITR